MIPVSAQHPSLYRLVITHYLVSGICFLCLALMLAFSSGKLSGHYFQPQLLAITHMAALGWGTLIIFGACYQLLPVILETELHSYRAGWISGSLFISGILLLVCTFWHFQPDMAMQTGSLLVLSGIILFGWNVFMTAKKAKRQDIHQDFVITACIWLICTAVAGTLLVFNFRYAFLPRDHLLFLKLHAHMGLAGWFLLLIIGVSSRLIPMFLVSTRQKTLFLTWSYMLINTGLVLFLIDTYVSGLTIRTYLIAGIAVAGILSWLIFVFQCVHSRMRKMIDLPMIHSLLSFFLLGIAILVLPFIIFYQLKADPEAIHYTVLYGALLFMGWISSLILGQAFKTLPFIVWIKRYQHLAGKKRTPMPADLFNKRVLQLQLSAFVIFLCSFYSGVFYRSPILVTIGTTCFLIVAGLYLANLIIVLSHKPETTDL
jgi:hypothetical protein